MDSTARLFNDVIVTLLFEAVSIDFEKQVSDISERSGEAEFLAEYAKSEYAAHPEATTHTADNVIFTVNPSTNLLQVLLIRRGNHPYKGFWCLPGGFIDPAEAPAQAAARELAEETQVIVDPESLNFVGTYDTPWRDPRLKKIHAHAFMTFFFELPEFAAADDAAEAELFNVVDVLSDPNFPIGFDHKQILADALLAGI